MKKNWTRVMSFFTLTCPKGFLMNVEPKLSRSWAEAEPKLSQKMLGECYFFLIRFSQNYGSQICCYFFWVLCSKKTKQCFSFCGSAKRSILAPSVVVCMFLLSKNGIPFCNIVMKWNHCWNTLHVQNITKCNGICINFNEYTTNLGISYL